MLIRKEDKAILLVEDDENDVILIKRAFERINNENPIIIAKNGEEAIGLLQSGYNSETNVQITNIIFILLDLKMPKKSGFDVLKWIKSHEKLKRIPVVILTSSSHEQDINKAYDLGANAYLVKPIRMEDLIEIVKVLNLHWVMFNKKPETGDN